MEPAKILLNAGPSKRGFHRLGLVLQCPQKYAWTYLDPRAAEEDMPPPLARGILIHVALAQHYARLRAYQTGQDMEQFFTPPDGLRVMCERDPRLLPHIEVARATYFAYADFYPPAVEVQEMEILMVEDVLEATIQGVHLVTGRLDVAFRDMAGRVWVMDHKSTVRITKAQQVYYSIHGQLWTYLFLARQKYGADLAGFRVNLVQHTASAPAQFKRFDLPRSRRLEQNIEQLVIDAEETILRNQHRAFDQWPAALNELTCYSRYGGCPFIDKCINGSRAPVVFDSSEWDVRDAPVRRQTTSRVAPAKS